MPFVPLGKLGAPFESVIDVDSGLFFITVTESSNDMVVPYNNYTTYTFHPRYVVVPLISGPPPGNNTEFVTRRFIVLPYKPNSQPAAGYDYDDANGTKNNWRFMRTVAHNGMFLSLEPDVDDEYYFDASATYNAAAKYLWQCRREGSEYCLRNTTTSGFILTKPTTYYFSFKLSPNPAVATLPIDLRIRSTEYIDANQLPAGATYNLRSYFGGLLWQSFSGANPAPLALFSPEFNALRPASCAVCFKKVPPNQTASGTDNNTYVVYFPRGRAAPNATLDNVFLAIENNNVVCIGANNFTAEKKFHFQVRLAQDTFPNAPDNFGLFTLYHPLSNKYLASGEYVSRLRLVAVSPPAAIVPPANYTVACEHHLLFFDFYLHCQPDVTPWPATEVHIVV